MEGAVRLLGRENNLMLLEYAGSECLSTSLRAMATNATETAEPIQLYAASNPAFCPSPDPGSGQ